MRRHMEFRYIPYIKVRYRTRAGRSIPMRSYYRNAMAYIRCILCIACLILSLNNIARKYETAVLNVTESNIISLIDDYIDKGVLITKNSFRENDLIKMIRNSDGKIISIKNDVVNANILASVVSENILSELKSIKPQKKNRYTGGIIENGILNSFLMYVPHKIIPVGKVNVTPEFTVENLGSNQIMHRLKIETSVKIRIIFPFHREEKLIKRVIILFETIIPGVN